MDTQLNNYELLISKLDGFIRKYYTNQIIKGVLYCLALILGIYLAVSLLEFKFYFSVPVRKLLFFGFIGLSVFAISSWVLLPMLRYFRLGKTIDHEQASEIIGQHFGDVQDRLLNVLQLKEMSSKANDRTLIEASIDQKIDAIKSVPFNLAIDLGKNKKYIKYAIVPLLFLVFILFAAPDVLKESNNRLIRNNTYFEREAPFQFVLASDTMEVVQYDDFEVEVKIEGSSSPEQVFIQSGDYTYKMTKNSTSSFSYTFNKLQKDVEFFFTASGFRSTFYTITVLPKPAIINFELGLDYPAYTGKKDEVLQNTGDVLVPVGTNIDWRFISENTQEIGMRFLDTVLFALRAGENEFVLNKKAMRDETYKIGVSNNKVKGTDSISYLISIIPDLNPSISAERIVDSTNSKYLFFLGEASDDYGLRNLYFKYKLEGEDGIGDRVLREESSDKISILPYSKRSQFTYSWDLSKVALSPGDRITYYFEVWDNDGVNGSKSARTPNMIYEVPTKKEFEQLSDKRNEDIKDKLEESLKEISNIKEEIEEMRNKVLQKKELSWEDKKTMEEMLNKQNEVQQLIDETKELFRQNLNQQEEYKQVSEEILQKQEKLQELFEEVLTDEMKELYKELEKLMEEMSKEDMMEEMDDMKLSQDQLENELDRMLELFKQLEFEQKLEEVKDKLEELADKQEELSKETEQNSGDNSDLEEKQEKLESEFEEVKKELSELEKMNEELENSNDMDDTGEKQEEISQEMQQGMQQMQSGKNKKASENQKNAAQKMDELAQQLNSMMQSMQAQQAMEDMDALRQILDNLIKLSFDQEKLMKDFSETRVNNPKYVELVQKQYKLKEDSEMVEDSLMALSKRVFQISTYVTREITEINKNMMGGLDNLEERRTSQAGVNQQFVMTGMNNLALMLDEVMQQMQQQMASMMQGNQMCQKPGGSKSQKPQMGQMQQQLNDQISKMKEQMKQGKQPGGSNPMLNSKEVAQMAAKQSAIRDALQKMSEELNGKPGKDGELARELQELSDEMEKTEEELVNKVLNNEMMERQQEILTRLLEAEEAMRQRDKDDKRESEIAQEISRETPPSIEEYLKKRQAEIDLYKTVPPNLKPYYKKLVENYFKQLSF